MKAHSVILLVVAVLLIGGTAMAQTGGPSPGQAMSVQTGTSSGGGYHLTSLAWQVNGMASGGDYGLAAAPAPTLRGSGCCCTYLPCVFRSW